MCECADAIVHEGYCTRCGRVTRRSTVRSCSSRPRAFAVKCAITAPTMGPTSAGTPRSVIVSTTTRRSVLSPCGGQVVRAGRVAVRDAREGEGLDRVPASCLRPAFVAGATPRGTRRTRPSTTCPSPLPPRTPRAPRRCRSRGPATVRRRAGRVGASPGEGRAGLSDGSTFFES